MNPRLWLLPDVALLGYLSYTAARAYLSPDHITYFFAVLGRPFYNITLTGCLFVIAELLLMILLRGPREAPFIVGFSLALFDSLNALLVINSTHWGESYLVAISLVYVTLFLAPRVAGGLRYRANWPLVYALAAFFLVDTVVFPPVYRAYLGAGEFTLYLFLVEPFLLSVSLFASVRTLASATWGRRP